FQSMYPRMIEILQLLGASGMMGRPTQADLEGPLGAEIARYYQAARLDAPERVRLFRLAWDLALSSFGSRQVIYERFFFGDPVRMQMATFANYDRKPYMERVKAFLARDAHEPAAAALQRDREPIRTKE
ncbi:MAG: 4-hydroxyphenylacetate 3-hydroxylase C-terminal domain-containing protein, partial [bacterium]